MMAELIRRPGCPWMSNFRPFDRETGFLLPPSLDDWLPERHLARFVVEVIGSLDLSAMARSYRGTGSASYHPELLLGVLVYGYTTGVFSSRKLERATYDSVAFRFISGNEHPDHDTIATFRRRFLKEIEGLFVRVLELAREMGLLKMGTVGLDGTKIHANASRHSALSYEHAGKIEAQLKAEVAELLARAEAADQAEAVVDGMSIPEELARREGRLAKLAEARAKIEARAKERFEQEMAEHRAKLAAREEKAQATGKKPGGRPPAPPVEGPQPKDQINLTAEDSRIMPVAGGGFDQCYNGQAVVATESLLVIAAAVVQAPNDKQQIAPMLEKIDALPEQLGRPETLLADNGYFSEANVMQCAAANIEPLIATGRQPHHPSWRERFAAPPPAPDNPTPVEAMVWRLRTPQGKQLYGLRKQTPEPVFGIIKSVMGFRQFLLRGLDWVRGEWSLVTMAWNIKRMFALSFG
jgi:transposase